MGNSWFAFKQFTIHQDQTAMKVCTDSCVFGATIPVNSALSILDIGAGTGLLALMLAQRSEATIDAVEIDPKAAKQAQKNIEDSPWADRITIHQTSVQDFFKYTTQQYDLIVCNPPFFAESIKTGNKTKDIALHQTHLSVAELMQVSAFMLKENGNAYFLISIYEKERFRNGAKSIGLNCSCALKIYDNPDKLIRYVLHLSKKDQHTKDEDKKFIIHDRGGNYTPNFVDSLKDFYLNLEK